MMNLSIWILIVLTLSLLSAGTALLARGVLDLLRQLPSRPKEPPAEEPQRPKKAA